MIILHSYDFINGTLVIDYRHLDVGLTCYFYFKIRNRSL